MPSKPISLALSHRSNRLAPVAALYFPKLYTYLTQQRLIRARNLMNNGMRATEACYACGFRSYSSFTRAYGKHFGTTPTGRADTNLIREEVPE